ncbi:MAG: methyltransferase domain-containing protein [Deltaproteobacteria bacterium]|nr:methyltransferase domain-containing protein [Deltaproteobacteria bacterium]
MKLNRAERLVVNNPVRVMIQRGVIRWIKGVTRIAPQARVLEIGCGRGAGARLIQEAFHPAVLHAFDLDYRMILQAGRYLKVGRRGRIALYVGDALRLPYRDGVLDAVFGFGVLHHLPDWRGGLREIARVLKPGGLYCLEEFYPQFYQNFLARRIFLHPEHDRFYSHDLRKALTEAGFELQGRLEQKRLGILAVAVKQALI